MAGEELTDMNRLNYDSFSISLNLYAAPADTDSGGPIWSAGVKNRDRSMYALLGKPEYEREREELLHCKIRLRSGHTIWSMANDTYGIVSKEN